VEVEEVKLYQEAPAARSQTIRMDSLRRQVAYEK